MKDLILVTGSEGLVGSRFIELYPERELLHIPRQIEFDITNKSEVKAIIQSFDFSAIVHFAAFTDVESAETQRGDRKGDCWIVNVEGTRNLVEAVAEKKEKIHFIQISTDMVFSGDKLDPGPYLENHQPEHEESRLTWYGLCKGEAEKIVHQYLSDHATVLRLIYPVRAQFEHKLDFLRKPLKLFGEGKLYPLFNNQKISITFIDEACHVIQKIIEKKQYGNFHSSSKDTTTPLEIVSYLLERVYGVDAKANSITLEEFLDQNPNSNLRYPKYGGLSVNMTEHRLGMKFSSWRQIIDKLVTQGISK